MKNTYKTLAVALALLIAAAGFLTNALGAKPFKKTGQYALGKTVHASVPVKTGVKTEKETEKGKTKVWRNKSADYNAEKNSVLKEKVIKGNKDEPFVKGERSFGKKAKQPCPRCECPQCNNAPKKAA